MALGQQHQSLSLAFSIVVVLALNLMAGWTTVVVIAAFFLSLFLTFPLFLQSFGA